MRRTIITAIAAAILVACAARSAHATDVGYSRKFGIGLELGDPTGLSAKLWVAPTNALDFGLGWWGFGVGNNCFRNGANEVVCNTFGGGTFNVDYLWQSNIVRGTAQLDWHIGAGGRAIWFSGCAGDCFDLGARLPLGLDLMFQNPNFLEVFFEVAPAFYVVPSAFPAFEGGLGVRGYL